MTNYNSILFNKKKLENIEYNNINKTINNLIEEIKNKYKWENIEEKLIEIYKNDTFSWWLTEDFKIWNFNLINYYLYFLTEDIAYIYNNVDENTINIKEKIKWYSWNKFLTEESSKWNIYININKYIKKDNTKNANKINKEYMNNNIPIFEWINYDFFQDMIFKNENYSFKFLYDIISKSYKKIKLNEKDRKKIEVFLNSWNEDEWMFINSKIEMFNHIEVFISNLDKIKKEDKEKILIEIYEKIFKAIININKFIWKDINNLVKNIIKNTNNNNKAILLKDKNFFIDINFNLWLSFQDAMLFFILLYLKNFSWNKKDFDYYHIKLNVIIFYNFFFNIIKEHKAINKNVELTNNSVYAKFIEELNKIYEFKKIEFSINSIENSNIQTTLKLRMYY